MIFKPLSLYIGLRYTRAKRRNHYISFISLVSVMGIALGVAVLITVLSVMNGFDQQIRARIFTIIPHIRISGVDGTLPQWKQLQSKLSVLPRIQGVAPYINQEVLLSNETVVHPALITGILPQQEPHVSLIGKKFIAGSEQDLQSGKYGIALGQSLAAMLGASINDYVNVITPQMNVTPIGVLPRFKRFKVVGIFKVGNGFGFDENCAFINLNDAQLLFQLKDKVSGLQIKVGDLFAAPAISIELQKYLGYQYQITDWTDQYGPFYHAVQMEKTMMFFILLLLIAIAAFNLISSLVMLVQDKQADIAILRTFGATPRMILGIFIIQGCILGIFGTVLGMLGGIFISLHVTQFVNYIQNTFHVQLLTSGVYFVDYLPSQLQGSDVLHICIAALVMCLVATLYPAWRASRTVPVEALRYE